MFAFLKNKFVRLYFYIFLVLIFSSAFLFSLPKLVQISEKNILISSDARSTNLENIVTARVKKTVIKLEDKGIPPPKIDAQGSLVWDLVTDKIVFSKNIHLKLSPASTTKIVSALVAVKYFKPADILTVTQKDLVAGSSMGLTLGETLSFRSLLYGMLLNSGNDASFAIADNFPGGFDAFIFKMNKLVEKLNLTDTHFDNPAGFDSSSNFSSAYDLAVFAKEAIKDPQISRIIATKETLVSAWDKSKSHNLKNLNKLLSLEGMIGIKTGSSEKAGENFIGLREKSNRLVLTVVLGSSDRFTETKDLLDWFDKNFDFAEVSE